LFESIKYITLAAAALLILLSWFFLQAGDPEALPDVVATSQEALVAESCTAIDPCAVELNDLLHRAETFDGAFVSTAGFLNVEFEGDSLYQSEADLDSQNYRQSVWLNLQAVTKDTSQLNETHVRITGQFYGAKNRGAYPSYGHMGLWAGEIDVIEVKATAPSGSGRKP
jgi:hypothetical protein